MRVTLLQLSLALQEESKVEGQERKAAKQKI